MAVCARCRRVSPSSGDTWCLACSAWEAIGNELSFSWSHPGLRAVATDLVVSAVRQVRALREKKGAAPQPLEKDEEKEQDSSESDEEEEESEAASDKTILVDPLLPPATAAPGTSGKAKPPVPPKGVAERIKTEEKADYGEEEQAGGSTVPEGSRHRRRHRHRSSQPSRPERKDDKSNRKRKHRNPKHRAGRKHKRLYRAERDPYLKIHRKLDESEAEVELVGAGGAYGLFDVNEPARWSALEIKLGDIITTAVPGELLGADGVEGIFLVTGIELGADGRKRMVKQFEAGEELDEVREPLEGAAGRPSALRKKPSGEPKEAQLRGKGLGTSTKLGPPKGAAGPRRAALTSGEGHGEEQREDILKPLRMTSKKSNGDSYSSGEDVDSSETDKEDLLPPLKKRSERMEGSALSLLIERIEARLNELSGAGERAFSQQSRDGRETYLLANVIDLLRVGRLAKLGDALAARWLAIEQASLDQQWSAARHLELYSPDQTSAAGPAITLAARKFSKTMERVTQPDEARGRVRKDKGGKGDGGWQDTEPWWKKRKGGKDGKKGKEKEKADPWSGAVEPPGLKWWQVLLDLAGTYSALGVGLYFSICERGEAFDGSFLDQLSADMAQKKKSQLPRAFRSKNKLFPLPQVWFVDFSRFGKKVSVSSVLHDLEFVKANAVACWASLGVLFCNQLANEGFVFGQGKPTAPQRDLLRAVEMSVQRLMDDDTTVAWTVADIVDDFEHRTVTYSGEEICKAEPLTLARVLPGLPPEGHGGSVDTLKWVSGRTRSLLLRPDLCLVTDVGQELPKLQGKVHIGEGEQKSIAVELVRREELGLEVDGHRSSLVYLACRVLPMGWCSAVGVMQDLAETILLKGGFDPCAQISKSHPLPPWVLESSELGNKQGRPWWHVYLDNFAAGAKVRDEEPSELIALQKAAESLWVDAGVVVSEDKSVVAASSGVELGAFLGGKGQWIGASPERLIKVLKSVIWLCGQPKLSKKKVQIVMRRLCFILQFRRPGMAHFSHVWEWVSGKGFGRLAQDKVRKEMLTGICGSPLFHTWLGSKIDPMVTCSDASMKGGAVAFSDSLTQEGKGFVWARERQAQEVPVVIVSLFNGIGGAQRCYDVAGVRVAGVLACDIHKPANRVTARRWPHTRFWEDVRTLTGEGLREEMEHFGDFGELHLWAGFPCVDVSSVRAHRQNLQGASSSLIHEAIRVFDELAVLFPDTPTEFFVENVASMDVEVRDQLSSLPLACPLQRGLAFPGTWTHAGEEVRVVYSQLFNVLALKFTPHGSEHIQATEISLIQGRLEPMCLGLRTVPGPSRDSVGDSWPLAAVSA
ncbi:unnamed protein product [Durusdinium trenchii]|uniref:DNA (cytosine-5-)-methyltransferase n=1 Tax=Durusdinium trenchii TaxID=1381693 RepID=A0ABP0RYI1_9DINO